MRFKTNDLVVFYGDSLTDAGKNHLKGEGSYVNNHLGNGYVNLFFGYMFAQYPELRLRIMNKGTSGFRSTDLVERLDDVLVLNPNHLFIMIGVNDAWRNLDYGSNIELLTSNEKYRDNLVYIIEKSLAQGINITLMTPFVLEFSKEDAIRSKINEYNIICRDLAKKYSKITFIDLQKMFDEYLLKTNNVYLLANDRIHVNITGHFLILNEISKTI